jgi:hypothetical protein
VEIERDPLGMINGEGLITGTACPLLSSLQRRAILIHR